MQDMLGWRGTNNDEEDSNAKVFVLLSFRYMNRANNECTCSAFEYWLKMSSNNLSPTPHFLPALFSFYVVYSFSCALAIRISFQ